MISYADDVTIYASGPNIPDLEDQLNNYMQQLAAFFEGRSLTVSASKSSVTLFTPHAAQAKTHPQVFFKNNLLPLVTTPKLLGVTLDTMLCFGPHCKTIVARVQQRNAILKALAGCTWGCDKETLLMSYRAICRSIISYCCPVWGPIIKDTHWNRLQVAQNVALRIATGCVRMTDIDDLHREAKELPVRNHNQLLGRQFAFSCHHPAHPCHHLCAQPDPPRPRMKPNMWYRHRQEYQHLLPATDVLSDDQLTKGIASLHKDAVDSTLTGYKQNVVLGGYPPPVSDAEETLPRQARTHMAQLRTGYSRHLNSYLARIDHLTADVCPDCNRGPHNTHHVFNCPANPTDLPVLSLWTDPVAAAAHLGYTQH